MGPMLDWKLIAEAQVSGTCVDNHRIHNWPLPLIVVSSDRFNISKAIARLSPQSVGFRGSIPLRLWITCDDAQYMCSNNLKLGWSLTAQ